MLRTLPYTFQMCRHLLPIRFMSSNAQDFIKVKNENGVREITLSHPRTRNSLSMHMMCALHDALTKDRDDVKLRCIVLTAEGKIWSAGHNLKELQPDDYEYRNNVFQKLTDIVLDITKLPVPVIAKVNGYAAAAGCQLVASCDIIVATDSSKFSTPGASVGVFCNTPGVAVARIMARPKSAFMLMTGLPLTGQEAYVAGLVSKVVPEAELDKAMNEIVCAIKSKSRAVIALGKEFYYRQINLPIEKAYSEAKAKMNENLQLDDCIEGMESFVEKRKPNWKHSN